MWVHRLRVNDERLPEVSHHLLPNGLLHGEVPFKVADVPFGHRAAVAELAAAAIPAAAASAAAPAADARLAVVGLLVLPEDVLLRRNGAVIRLLSGARKFL